MSHGNEAAIQRRAGRIAGITLLVLIITGFTSIFLQQGMEIDGNAAASGANILAHEFRYRAGILANIAMLNCDIVLALALYALLRPSAPALALLGSAWRIANAILLGCGAAATMHSVSMLHLAASQPGVYQLSQTLRDFSGSASTMGLLFFCLGAAVHSYLLYRTRYIPRVLSASYLAVSLQLLAGCCIVILHPVSSWALGMVALVPDLLVELSVALWLTIKGVQISD